MDVPQLSADENAAWERRLGNAYFACGCGEGALLGILGLIGYAAWAILQPEPLAWADALWLIGTFFLASGLGKAIGLARARRRLATAVEDLGRLLEAREAHRPAKPDERPPEPPEERLCAVGQGG